MLVVGNLKKQMKQIQYIITIIVSVISIILGLTFCYFLILSLSNNSPIGYSNLSHNQIFALDLTSTILVIILMFFQITFAFRENKKITLIFSLLLIFIILLHFTIDNYFTSPAP